METKKKDTPLTGSAKALHQTIRDVGASLLSLPAFVEQTTLLNGANPTEVVAITSSLRYLCTALIKNDVDAIKTRCQELEIALVEAQKSRLLLVKNNSAKSEPKHDN
jgi:hypothetical protein